MSFDTEKVLLEERKVKALEKIASNLIVLVYGLKKSIKMNGVID